MRALVRSASFILAMSPVLVMAHAGLEITEATQNSSYKAIIKIGHGCEGSATHTVRVEVPEGMIAAKPMPKAGWTVQVENGPYARAYDYFGTSVKEGAKAIVWSGGNLADAEYDEFVFVTRLTDVAPGKLYIPVTQTCAKGQQAWTQIPRDGQDAHALAAPAPSLTVKQSPARVAQAGGGHAGHGSHGAAPAAQASGIAVSTAWTRATPPGSKVAGGFFTIENKSGAADRLIGGSTDASGIFEVHEMAMNNGIMQMRALEKGLEIPSGGKVELKPGGFHIMLIDLKRQLKDGDTVTGELVFEKAGKVPVSFKVMPIGSTSGGHQH